MMRYKTIKNLPVVKQALTTKAVVFQSRELIEKLLYFLLWTASCFCNPQTSKIYVEYRKVPPWTPLSLNSCSFSAYPLLALFPLRYADLGDYVVCAICFLTIQVFCRIVSAVDIWITDLHCSSLLLLLLLFNEYSIITWRRRVIYVTAFMADLLYLLLLVFAQLDCNTGLFFPPLFFLFCYTSVVIQQNKSFNTFRFYCNLTGFVI